MRFKRGDDNEAAAPAMSSDYEMLIEFAPDYLIFTAMSIVDRSKRVHFRLSRADLRQLKDEAWLDAGFAEAGTTTERRVCDQEAIEKMAKVWRYLKHGLDFGKISKIMGEDADALRRFYGWAITTKEGAGGLGEMARQKEIQQDILPLRNPIRSDAGPIREVQVFASQIGRANQAGVEPAALKLWEDLNRDIIDALK
jgi:hypothetical protein